MSEYMAAQMDSQIEGAISENERLSNDIDQLRQMVTWAYCKLHSRAFANQEDALMLDRLKFYTEHGVLA